MSDEVLYILLAAGAILVLAAVVMVRARAGAAPLERPPVGADLTERVRWLCERGRQIHAIKLVREEIPGIGLKEAKDAVDAIAAGRPSPLPPRIGRPVLRPAATGDLAERVRALKAAGRTEQAVFLVRGETGMNEGEASAFVAAVEADAP
ncbi:hypothetical protein HNP84_006360 [Thermocatellispora tengchongensis]|uniref:Ribosomal protein L7/L12 C-terminal domain-containing protein n=2 Tax=Thermocatellispora tengchongensis TaxID=1073253 RepID=A0A840PC95_9ACTN|nr:50S ribosomal protein L7/L12 [Thermocatellispora tengchongensis]MBB5136609.1 hypothetical protein [Thermocatellispora tengchongensis]